MRCLLFVLFLLPAHASDTIPKDLDTYIDKALKDWRVPGVGLAIVSGDRVVLARGYGVQDIDTGRAVDEHTVFAVGSTTKAFTATALAMLVDQGKLKWDDPAGKHLPGFQLYDPAAGRQLTVRDLLCHRTGLPRGDWLWYGADYTREQVLERVRHLPPQWGFRERFGYQNIMFLAAGQIIPRIEGYGWDGYLRDKIFTPLGMKNTSTSTLALKGKDNTASPHAEIDGKTVVIPRRNLDNVGPAGSINSSAYDMARWLRFNLNEGSFDGKKMLEPKQFKELMTPQTVVRLEGRYVYFFADARFAAYGLGWFLHDYHGAWVADHGGSIDGMRAQITLLPEKKLGVVILTNLNQTLLPIAIKNRVLDSWLGRPEKDWSGYYLEIFRKLLDAQKENEKKRTEKRKADALPSLPLARYAGDYTNTIYKPLKISLKDGKLYFGFTKALSGTMEHWHYDTFRVTWDAAHMGRNYVTFHLDADGRVARVVLENITEFTPK
ncbi:MAG: serine hydrolase [Acidobacteriota bacterium]|nr:serine hydrolase [Acidobacteriota bacterium]